MSWIQRRCSNSLMTFFNDYFSDYTPFEKPTDLYTYPCPYLSKEVAMKATFDTISEDKVNSIPPHDSQLSWMARVMASDVVVLLCRIPDSKVYGANMGSIWGRQDPGGPRVGPMNLSVWVVLLCILVWWQLTVLSTPLVSCNIFLPQYNLRRKKHFEYKIFE